MYSAKVKHKVFQLDNPAKEQTAATKEQSKKRKRANKSKALTAKEKRALHVYDIPLESRKYGYFNDSANMFDVLAFDADHPSACFD